MPQAQLMSKTLAVSLYQASIFRNRCLHASVPTLRVSSLHQRSCVADKQMIAKNIAYPSAKCKKKVKGFGAESGVNWAS